MSKPFDLNADAGGGPTGGELGATEGAGDGTGASTDAFGGTTLSDGSGDPRGGDYVFDPDLHISRDKLNANGTYRRKRQRRGSGGIRTASKRPKADIQTSIDGLSKTLLIMHVGLAEMTKTPELVLTEPESDGLATSIANALSEFDITPDPKIQAIVGLVMCAGMIYGPRLYNIRERIKLEGPSLRRSATLHTLRPVATAETETVTPPADAPLMQ